MQPDLQSPPESAGLTGPDVTPTVRKPFRRYEACPRCGLGKLDYNGLLDLECPACGYTEGSGAGCT